MNRSTSGPRSIPVMEFSLAISQHSVSFSIVTFWNRAPVGAGAVSKTEFATPGHDVLGCATIKTEIERFLMLINLNQQSPALPLIPTGSLIKTNSKFGHELIAGPIVNNKQ